MVVSRAVADEGEAEKPAAFLEAPPIELSSFTYRVLLHDVSLNYSSTSLFIEKKCAVWEALVRSGANKASSNAIITTMQRLSTMSATK